MKVLRLVLLAALLAPSLVVLGATQALACSCIPPRPDEQAIKDAAAVFTGTIAEPTPHGTIAEPVTWTFAVDTVYKGDVGATQDVSAHTQGPACGIVFKEEKRYAVFAYEDKGELHTNSCSNTRSIEAGETLDLAAAGVPPGPPSERTDDGVLSNAFVVGALALLGVTAILSVVALTRRRRTSD